MEIVFQSTSDTVNFENWLKAFSGISDSLLLEVDPNQQMFVAKSYTQEKTIVKYGKISFADACLEVVSVTGKDRHKVSLDEWNETNSARIKVGIYHILDKFIKVVDTFGSTENHKIVIKFDEQPEHGFVAQKIEFKSLTLNMAAPAAEMEEFSYISDDQFINGIARIDNPVYFSHSSDAAKLLTDFSNIFSADAKKDIIDFNIQKDGGEWVLHAIDYSGKSYDYKMGYLDQNKTDETASISDNVHVPVIRQNYILGTRSDKENGTIVVSGNEEDAGKLAVHSGDSFITIIATVRV